MRSRLNIFGFSLLASGAALLAAAHPPEHHEASLRSIAPTVEHTIRLGREELAFESVAGWCKLPDDRPIGNTHGTIVIDREGLVYFNTDTDRSIMVHSPTGEQIRVIAERYPGIHGMVIREEDGEEYIYAAHLAGKQALKLKLDGTVIWMLNVPVESGKYDDNQNAYNPTSIAVGPDGDIYVADGYGRNWIHQFDAERHYIRSFGGPGSDPGQFRTCHGIAIDNRGDEPALIVCDRENRRLQRFTLEGEFIDVVATDLRRPCSISFSHDGLMAVAELEGRVTIFDNEFNIVTHLGDNPNRDQWAKNGVPPDQWIDGVFTAPHGCCFDDAGNLYVMDWNASGRVSKLKRVKPDGEVDR